MISGKAVFSPCPISGLLLKMTMVPSDAMRT